MSYHNRSINCYRTYKNQLKVSAKKTNEATHQIKGMFVFQLHIKDKVECESHNKLSCVKDILKNVQLMNFLPGRGENS